MRVRHLINIELMHFLCKWGTENREPEALQGERSCERSPRKASGRGGTGCGTG
jgi:hypothetical protein